MDSLRAELEAKGISTKALSDDQVKAIGKAMHLAIPRAEVAIVDYEGAKYVKTDNFVVPNKKDGTKQSVARGLFLRVEALDTAIAELQAAKAKLSK
jgi:hypothetical protein